MNCAKDKNQFYKYKYCKYLIRSEKKLGKLQDYQDVFSVTSSEDCNERSESLTLSGNKECIDNISIDSSDEIITLT